MLGCGDPSENVTQTATLSKLIGTRWAHHGLEVPLDRYTDMYMVPRGGIMTAIHRCDIMEPIVGPQACANGDAFILMQDNARAHTTQVSMNSIDDTGIRVMNGPARYPDLNPSEHTSGILSRRIRQRHHHPENVQDLIDVLVQKLQAIPLTGIRSMTRCCQQCVNDKGGQASYW